MICRKGNKLTKINGTNQSTINLLKITGIYGNFSDQFEDDGDDPNHPPTIRPSMVFIISK